jgi:hypothetical protein
MYSRALLMILGAVLVGAAISGCGDDDGAPTDVPPSILTVSTTTAPATAPRAAPARTATPTPLPRPPLDTIMGLFREPRPREIDAVRQLPPRPVTPFLPWDRVSAVVYDFETGTETNLGPGSLVDFSPNSTMGVWVAGDGQNPGADAEAWAIDLGSGERWRLGPAITAWFVDDRSIVIQIPSPGGGGLGSARWMPSPANGSMSACVRGRRCWMRSATSSARRR